MPKLPKTIYVALRESDTDDAYLLAERTPEDAIDEDGPTVVGTYQLVSSTILKKVAQRSR